MHALVFDRFGPPEVLEWREVADPVLQRGMALVRLGASGLNFADIYRREGRYHLAGDPPWIPGYEGAGTIERIEPGDEGAHDLAVGMRVGFADIAFANAELIAAPLDRLIPLPDDISDETAAALLLQGLTAQYLARDSHAIAAGETVVVHAAAGGVGLLLCQMAATAGATVIALASSPEKRAAAQQAGAAYAFDYEDWVARVRSVNPDGADVIYDSVGITLADSLKAARTGGAIVFYGFAGGDPEPVDPRLLMDRSLTLTGGDLWNVLTSAEERRSRAADLFTMMRSGRLTVNIAAHVPLPCGAEAHRLLEGRQVVGKIVMPASGS